MLFEGKTLSDRDKIWPGTIERVTGKMEMCEECCRNYRRMTTNPDNFLCGSCSPIYLAGNIKIPYGEPASSDA